MINIDLPKTNKFEIILFEFIDVHNYEIIVGI